MKAYFRGLIHHFLGEHNRLDVAGTEQTHDAKEIFRPPKAGKDGRDDLAMVKLQRAIKPTAFVHTVCYDEDPVSSLIWPTQYGVVTGWGSKTRVGFDKVITKRGRRRKRRRVCLICAPTPGSFFGKTANQYRRIVHRKVI